MLTEESREDKVRLKPGQMKILEQAQNILRQYRINGSDGKTFKKKKCLGVQDYNIYVKTSSMK